PLYKPLPVPTRRSSDLLGGVHGHSPYAFDEYRYGRQTIMFDESLILNKYISVGYRGTLSPLKDNYDKDILTENRFYAVVGPEDVDRKSTRLNSSHVSIS